MDARARAFELAMKRADQADAGHVEFASLIIIADRILLYLTDGK